ncbi:hypothetical protein [Sporosarcina highlanderae]|uniref:Uncharacterized protein n=1 Tax=Sporosarcina highlanderae TaxID=3035916 RepID=A0ABT8JVA6_9BACL|nr:hypothetical protein [Sporosarcina highlanderae]MDN4609111.1 hypothetical protein [Sporosarcina highlanderae]
MDREFELNCAMTETVLENFKKLTDDEESLEIVETMLLNLKRLKDRHL